MNVKDLPRYSSSIGQSLHHVSFKVKYCHKVFLNTKIRKRCHEIFMQAAEERKIDIQEVGFDADHTHLMIDFANRWNAQGVVKILKGRSGKFILNEFPELRRKMFRKNRFWSPAYYFEAVGKNEQVMRNYISNQKLSKQEDRKSVV